MQSMSPSALEIGLVAGAVVALAIGGTVAWLRLVAWRYRLADARPQRSYATCKDGWQLAIHHRPAPVRRFREPVLLCPGLAASHYYFDFDRPYSVATFLAE